MVDLAPKSFKTPRKRPGISLSLGNFAAACGNVFFDTFGYIHMPLVSSLFFSSGEQVQGRLSLVNCLAQQFAAT